MENGKDEFKNLLISGLGVTLLLALGFMGYTYQTKEIVPKNSVAKMNKGNSFEDLPPSVQDKYISKSTYLTELSQIESEKEQLARELQEIVDDTKQQALLKKTAVMQKDLDKQIIDETNQNINQNTMTNTPLTDRTKFKTYTCKSFEKGSIVTPSSCKKGLYQFLDKHKEKAKEFEVIGMVDKTEFKLIQNLEDVYGTSEVKEVKKYVQIGLSRQRVIEVTWLAKQHLPKYTPIGAVNYTVYSNNKRGFVIRAYY